MPSFGAQQTLDRLTYITPDGVEYMLSSPLFVLQEDGYGMPPLEYVTQRGPFQDGESVKAVFLRPRTVQLVIRRNGCSRAEYWNIRNTLLDILRPRRSNPITGVAISPSTPGILRKYLANGAIRELFAFPSEGPGFPSHGPETWDEYSVQDTLRFTCYDPVARDPKLQSAAFVSSGSITTFPITFPLTIASFGSNTLIKTDGTWDTFPTIVINGPLTGATIVNTTTGERIALGYTIPAGHVVTFDLGFGRKTVTLDDGTNLIGYVTADSDLGTFHLQPGNNNMQVFGTGTSGTSSITLQWYKRYIGF